MGFALKSERFFLRAMIVSRGGTHTNVRRFTCVQWNSSSQQIVDQLLKISRRIEQKT